MTSPSMTGRNQMIGAVFLAVAMAAVVGAALGFQYLGGYMPCELCLKERIPYYVGVPLMIVAAIAAALEAPAGLVRSLLGLGMLAMLIGAGLSIYHAGVEWHWWAGPSSCTGSAGITSSDATNLLANLNTVKPPSCDVAALRILGLSLAGWNVVATLVLAIVAAKVAFGREGK